MKIDNALNSLGGIVSGTRTPNIAKSVPAKPSEGQGADVELSPLSTRLQNIDGAEIANSEKVAQIREAIAQGRFTIDSNKIADGLIDSVRQMLQLQR